MKKSYHKLGERLEAGIDEVARGCLAGPVCSAAVIWPEELELEEAWAEHMIKDSKKLSKKKREMLSDYIKENSVDWSVSHVSNQIIDKINIRNATFQAMHNAINDLNITPDFLLVDGNGFMPYFDENGEVIEHTCVISGDDTYISIAAASILAKVHHDTIIESWCEKNPNLNIYEWKSNMCYGTKNHIEAITQHGISPLHRKSFGLCQTSKMNPIFKNDVSVYKVYHTK